MIGRRIPAMTETMTTAPRAFIVLAACILVSLAHSAAAEDRVDHVHHGKRDVSRREREFEVFRVIRVPLTAEGRIPVAKLVGAVSPAAGAGLGANAPENLSLDPSKPSTSVALELIERTLGPGCEVHLTEEFVEIRLDRAADLRNRRQSRRRLAATLMALVPPVEPPKYGLTSRPSYRPEDATRTTVCLVHGMDATARIWDAVVEPLEQAGFGVVLFQYPNDQAIDKSAHQLAADLARFRRERGDRRRWHLVTHSMGGLVARAYVEDSALYGKDVDRLIMLAPPNHGSNLASGRFVVEWVTHVRERWQEGHSFWTALADGLGEAGEDLMPGSLFLTRLNSRPRNPSVRYSIVAGDMFFFSRNVRDDLSEEVKKMRLESPVLLELREQALEAMEVQLVPELIDGYGDGAVSVKSARLEGVLDFELLRVDHLSLLGIGPFAGPGEPPCLEPVLRRLKSDRSAEKQPAQKR